MSNSELYEARESVYRETSIYSEIPRPNFPEAIRPSDESVDWFFPKRTPKDLPWLQPPRTITENHASSYRDLWLLPDLAASLLDAKCVLDRYDNRDVARVRSRLNPYESLGSGPFINRAAIKMANLDHLTNLVPHPSGQRFSFVDLCGGPGGFSEYVLWKTRDSARGWGISLDTDGSLRWSLRGTVQRAVHRGDMRLLLGADGTGDLTRPANIQNFVDSVRRDIRSGGVDLVLGDGAFSVEGNENHQESLTWRLILCELVTSVMLLEPGGSLMCKLFDCFEPRTVDLIYAVSLHFDQVALVKPLSSRPANSERYLVCKGARHPNETMIAHLLDWNKSMEELWPMPDRLLQDDIGSVDAEFARWLLVSNNQRAEHQIRELERLGAGLEQDYCSLPRQINMRDECFSVWGLPNRRTSSPNRATRRRSSSPRRRDRRSHYHSRTSSVRSRR